jgi:hypothetical protein
VTGKSSLLKYRETKQNILFFKKGKLHLVKKKANYMHSARTKIKMEK